jgi:arylsulfatase
LPPVDWVLNTTGVGDRYNWRWKKDWFIQWPNFYDKISDQLRQTSSPSFFWAFLLDTHEPYLSPSAYREENNAFEMYYAVVKDKLASDGEETFSEADEERLRRAYRDATRSVDNFVATILEDCANDTVVIFHSDHGEAFGEHGSWGHKSELFQKNLHVPFFVSGGVQAERVRQPISLGEIPAMVEKIASEPIDFDPWSFTDPLTYATTENGSERALCTREWKYITSPDRTELFSLVDDPGEQHDVSDEHPELVEHLGQIEQFRRAKTTERASIAAGVMEVEGV